ASAGSSEEAGELRACQTGGPLAEQWQGMPFLQEVIGPALGVVSPEIIVDAQGVIHRGGEPLGLDRLVFGKCRDLVGRAVDLAATNPSAGKQRRLAHVPMVPAGWTQSVAYFWRPPH